MGSHEKVINIGYELGHLGKWGKVFSSLGIGRRERGERGGRSLIWRAVFEKGERERPEEEGGVKKTECGSP